MLWPLSVAGRFPAELLYWHSLLSTRGSESKSHSGVWDSLQPHGHPWNFLGQNTGVGSLSPSPGDLPTPGIELRSPTLQANSLPGGTQGKPKDTGVGSLSFYRGCSWPRKGLKFPLRDLSFPGPTRHVHWWMYMVAGRSSVLPSLCVFWFQVINTDTKHTWNDSLGGHFAPVPLTYYSLKGLMLKLKLQYFGHLMQRANSLEKTLRKIEAEGEGDNRGWDGWMASLTQWT